jgi:hypothetical protein
MAKLIIISVAVYLLLAAAMLQAGIEPVNPALGGASDVHGCIMLSSQEGLTRANSPATG